MTGANGNVVDGTVAVKDDADEIGANGYDADVTGANEDDADETCVNEDDADETGADEDDADRAGNNRCDANETEVDADDADVTGGDEDDAQDDLGLLADSGLSASRTPPPPPRETADYMKAELTRVHRRLQNLTAPLKPPFGEYKRLISNFS